MIIEKSKTLLDKTPVSLVLFAVFMFYTFNSIIAGSPIFASDEYVYFVSGKYIEHLPDLYRLDPGLQRLSNLLFFHEVNFFNRIFDDKFISLFRVIHSLEYIAAGVFLYMSARRFMSKSCALMGLVVFFALPSHIYIYAVMPEVELVFLSATITLILVSLYPRRPVLAATITGFLVAIALLIKPHAMAMLAALLVLLPTFNFLYFRKRFVRISAQAVVCFLLALYAGVIVLWCLMDGHFTFNPSGALGLTFYGKYIDAPPASVSILTKLLQVGLYFAANLTVVLLLFLPVFLWVVSLVVQRLQGRLSIGEGKEDISPELVVMVLFAMLSIAAHLLMTAWFTAGAAILNAGEAQRVHGRYLGPALVAFPFLFFYSLDRLSPLSKKILPALTLITLMIAYWFVSQYFKIYPWDNPLLFAFFSEDNWYGWNYLNLGIGIGSLLYLAIFLGFVASLLFRPLQSVISSVVLCLIVAVGCFQGYLWMYVHLHGTHQISQTGRYLAGLIGEVGHGDGVLIGRERYGRESYLLFNLASAPKVNDRPEGSEITQQDIAGYSWLITDGNYDASALGLPSTQVGSLKYYALKPSARVGIDVPRASVNTADKPMLKPKSIIEVSLASAPAGVGLVGFNSVEPWGAWTSKPAAAIELPVKLKGRVRVRLFSWTLEQNLGVGISLQVGDQVKRLPISASGADYEVDFQIDAETDRILLKSAVDRPPESGRVLGVAVARISVESL